MKINPKISIVIPSYNKAKYIGETIESIINQKYSNIEVIIRDGGSTDNSIRIIKKYVKKYPKIIKWVSKNDGGQLDAINRGLSCATGDILTFINADDKYIKGSFSAVIKSYLNNPNSLWFAGYGNIINERGKEISSWVTFYKILLQKINKHYLLLMVNYLMQPAVFIKKEAYIKYGPFKGEGKWVMEYDMWIKLSKISMPVVIQKYLASFRITGDNVSFVSFKKILTRDHEIAKRNTNNKILIAFHLLHNIARIIIMNLISLNK